MDVIKYSLCCCRHGTPTLLEQELGTWGWGHRWCCEPCNGNQVKAGTAFVLSMSRLS